MKGDVLFLLIHNFVLKDLANLFTNSQQLHVKRFDYIFGSSGPVSRCLMQICITMNVFGECESMTSFEEFHKGLKK